MILYACYVPFREGSIPFEVGQLKQLEVLNLSKNNFTGIAKDGLAGLSSLTHLYMWNNTLTCTDVGNLPSKARCYDDCRDLAYDDIDERTKKYMDRSSLEDACEM